MSHKFNWQEEDRSSMLHWMLPEVLDSALIDTLSPMTEHFTKVDLSIRINNVEVDVVKFMNGLQRSLDYGVEEGVKDFIMKSPKLAEFQDEVSALESGLRRKVQELAKEHGISLNENDWYGN